MNNEAIVVKNIYKEFVYVNFTVSVIKNISLQINVGEFICIIGESGSGKTTLINLLSGLDRPTKGDIKIYDNSIVKLSDSNLLTFRRNNIGYIAQKSNLFLNLTIYENIIFPSNMHNQRYNKGYIDEMLKFVNLYAYKDRYPLELSGGQQQLVSILRSLSMHPKILFADEPTGNLDSNSSNKVMKLLIRLVQDLATTLVVVSHSINIAKMSEKIITLKDGQIKGYINKNDFNKYANISALY